jgi:hypothetical protein
VRALDRLGLDFDVIGTDADLAKLDQLAPAGAAAVVRADFADPAALAATPFDLTSYDRVLSFTELGLFPAAVCNALAGREPTKLTSAYLTRNKAAMRNRLTDAGLTTVRRGFGPSGITDRPVITKPVDGSSSVGVAIVAPELRKLIAADTYWEEVIGGVEFSVEAVSRSGKHDILGVTRKFHSNEGRFIEVGHVFTTAFEDGMRGRVSDYVTQVLDELQFATGASHTEVKVHAETALVDIIETHTRPGGDAIPQLAELVTGRDQYTEAVAAELWDACGWAPELPVERAGPVGAAAISIFGLGAVTARDVLNLAGCEGDFRIVDDVQLAADGSGSDARNSRIVVTTDSEAAVKAAQWAFDKLYSCPPRDGAP